MGDVKGSKNKSKRTANDSFELSKYAERLLENINDLVQSIGTDGKFVYVNRKWRETLGYSLKEAKGMSFEDILRRDQIEHCSEIFQGLLKGEKYENIETVFVTKKGEEIYVEGNVNTVVEDGKVEVTIGVFHDITEHKCTNEALQQSEERFRQLVGMLPEAVCEVDTLGKVIFANNVASLMLGYDKSDIAKGVNIFSMIVLEDQDKAATNIQRMIEGEVLGSDEYTLVRRDGSKFPAFVHISNILDKSGKTTGFRGIVVDITERKKAEEMLRESEKNYRQLIETLQEGVWAIDKDANTTFANPRMALILGYTVEEMLGKSLFSFMDERGVEIAKYNMERRKQGIVEQHDFEFLRKDGRRIYATLETSPLTDEKGDFVGALAGVIDITERKKAEEALRESEERLKILFEYAPDAYTLSTLDGTIVDANRASFELTGYSREEVISKSFISMGVISLEQFEVGAAATAHRPDEPLELVVKRKDGTKVTVETKTFSVEVKGHPLLLSISRDITERKKAEEIQQHLVAIVESSHDAIIGKTLDGIITSWNKGAEERYGYSAAEVVGHPISILIPPERADEMPQFLTKVSRGEAVIDYESERIAKDGRRVTVLLTISPIKDTSGKIVGASTIAQDITERKRLGEMLKESEQKFRELAELLPQAIFEIDFEGRLTYANSYGFESTGYTRENLEKGINAIELFVPEQRDRIVKNILAVLSGEKFDDHEYSVLRKDGSTYPVLIYSNIIMRDGKPVGVRGIVLDITERKKIEQMKTDFVSFISHQLRTPVAGLMGYIDNMLDGVTGELNSKQIEYLSGMRGVCERNSRLIADLLNISRIERGVLTVNISPVDLRSVVDSAVKEHRKSIEEKGLVLSIKEADQGIVVLADIDKLVEVLKNVIHNAAKFTSKGSISIEIVAEGQRGIVKVSDTGMGMSKESLQDLFKKDKVMSGAAVVGGGAGLGLYIAKGFMQLQHGDIMAESVEGEGSTFIIRLPKK